MREIKIDIIIIDGEDYIHVSHIVDDVVVRTFSSSLAIDLVRIVCVCVEFHLDESAAMFGIHLERAETALNNFQQFETIELIIGE